MDLPTSREIELETLIRQRDAQVAELTDELTHLRQYLSTQPPPSIAEPVSLPPALVAVLLPHINDGSLNVATAASGTVTAALTQRAKTLQRENDELYELLKTGETGKLKEDVRALRRVVQKLEGALRESHSAISNLSAELEKSHEALAVASRQNKVSASSQSHSQSQSQSPAPRHQPPPHLSGTNGAAKPPPTAPRAHKKPRLSESRMSPPAPAPTRRAAADRKPPPPPQQQQPKMEVDDDARAKPRARSPERERGREKEGVRGRERERPRERERDRGRERERDRERDRDRTSKRNGGYGGGGRRGGGRGVNGIPLGNGGDRTLAERMGL